jgi:multidrug efflux pump subunit AcrB
MNISHFFIDRPIFASVISIVFVILGGVAFARLPVAQYPEIAPPTITINGQFPGASAETIAETVVAPIEQQVNGVEGMLYISSNSTADGRFSTSASISIPRRCRCRTASPPRRRACRNRCSRSASRWQRARPTS